MSRGPADRGSAVRVFVLAVPGLAPLVRRELEERSGITVTDTGNDGRADVLVCEAEPVALPGLLDLATAEDVFVEVGRTLRSAGDRAGWTAGRLWKGSRVGRALAVWSRTAPKSTRRGPTTYRVITRVLQERSYPRVELRKQLTRTIGSERSGWRPADPASVEVWVVEYAAGKLLAGIRLSDEGMRQHGTRAAERSGALRPTVAAAMVRLAGQPSGGLLLDPCCGSGTILAEAVARGWRVAGRDSDSEALSAARRNVAFDSAPGASEGLELGDVRALDLADGAVDAAVSNLPFGRQYAVEGDAGDWIGDALGELARVTRPGGRVVVLVPNVPRSAVPCSLRLDQRHPLRLLGTRTTLWAYDRRA